MAHAQISPPDPQEHVAQGKAARKAYPRSALANIEFPADRRDPVDILMAQSESRVQELVPIRYGRMSASPFTFYRGAAAIMAADLGVGPNTGLTTQLCGDAHLANFGVYSSRNASLSSTSTTSTSHIPVHGNGM